jgi:hypothetical protein
VVVAWRLSSTNGASIGSLRAAAAATGAELGDTLVVVLGLKDASLDVVRVAAGVGGVQRLRALLGRTVRSPAAALSTSLECPRGDVEAVLRSRGDGDLADLLGPNTP